MKKIKVAVVGLGMGSGHVVNFQAHPNVEVVALVDLDNEKLQAKGKEFKVKNLYNSLEEMLKEHQLDIVAIAVPNKFHKPLTITALESGAHVLCEKPMAMNTQEAEDMLAVAKKCNKRLMINFSTRFTPQAFAMKKEVESGVIGDIYYARTLWLRRRGMPGFGGWFGQKALAGGGPIIDLGVHRLDLALWLMDYPKPTWVLANTFDPIASREAKKSGKAFDVEDMGVASIKFENGAMLTLEASWASNIKQNEEMETRIFGTDGGLRQVNLNEGYEFEAELYIDRDGRQYDMKLHPPVPDSKSSMHHLVDAILNDEPNIATAEEGIIVMEILDAIYKSAELGEPVKL